MTKESMTDTSQAVAVVVVMDMLEVVPMVVILMMTHICTALSRRTPCRYVQQYCTQCGQNVS
jgi:hypothetical protein